MDPIRITVSNYRCFPADHPVKFDLCPGFTAILGPNNAGKTAILRMFVEMRQVLNPNGAVVLGGPSPTPSLHETVSDAMEVFNHSTPGPLRIRMECDFEHPGHHRTETTAIEVSIRPFDPSRGREVQASASWENALPVTWGHNVQPGTMYLHPVKVGLGRVTSAMYVPSERNAVEKGVNAKHFDLTMGAAFINKWDEMKNGSVREHSRIALRIQRDLERLLGISRLDIAKAPQRNQLNCHIDGNTYRLEELGSGLQHMMLVLAQAAMTAPDFILIDEPETGLHPTLQVDYLTTLGSYAKQGVIFTTHNYGLAMAVADRTYCVIPESHGRSRCVKYTHGEANLIEFAGALHYGAYGTPAHTPILLVEGPTELRVFSEFIRLLGLPRRVLPIHLGGGTSINKNATNQLRNIRALGASVAAFVDSERTQANSPPAKNVEEFAAACKELGIKCYVTERRATENYFTSSAVQSAFGPSAKALGHFEVFGPAAGWGKAKNWRAAREMSKRDLEQTDLGRNLIEFASSAGISTP